MYLKFNNITFFEDWHAEVNHFYRHPDEEKPKEYTQVITNQVKDDVCCHIEIDELPQQFMEGQTILTEQEAKEQGLLPKEHKK